MNEFMIDTKTRMGKFLIFLLVVVVCLFCKVIILSCQLNNARKIYVYNLEEIVSASGIVKLQKELEDNVNKLNDEVLKAQKKITAIRDAKVKEDFSEMYVKSLELKRDDLYEKYNNEMIVLTDKLNDVMRQIAKEKNASTIYSNKNITVQTPFVIDVTPEILDILKKN